MCPVSQCLTVKVAIPVLHNHEALKLNLNLIVKSAFVRLNCYFLCLINVQSLNIWLIIIFINSSCSFVVVVVVIICVQHFVESDAPATNELEFSEKSNKEV